MSDLPHDPSTHYICGSCGADFPPGRWCPECSAPASSALMVRGVREGEQGPDPRAGQEWSRWRAGTTTFGPVGRVVASILIAGFVALGWYITSFLPGPGWTNYVFLVPYVFIALIGLRGAWARERVLPRRRRFDGRKRD